MKIRDDQLHDFVVYLNSVWLQPTPRIHSRQKLHITWLSDRLRSSPDLTADSCTSQTPQVDHCHPYEVIRLTISFKHGSGFPNPLIIGCPRLQLPNNKKYMVNMCVNMKIKNTSSTAQGGGGSFKNRKPIGEVGCGESGMAERTHWWIERWLISLTLSLSFSDYLPGSKGDWSLSLFLSLSLTTCLSLYLFIYISIYLSIYLAIYLSI